MRKRKTADLADKEEADIQQEIAADPDDWTPDNDELAQARPFADAFPDLMESIRRGRGRPRVAAPKAAVTLRLDPATLSKFKAAGENWRARMAKVLDETDVSSS